MKLHAFVLAFGGVLGAAAAAQAQTAPAPSDPLSDAQGIFGNVVGEAFRRPDPVVEAAAPGAAKSVASTFGVAARTTLEVPGAAFAAIVKPFADADAGPTPAPEPVAPRHRRHAHHRAPAQG